uniref:Uncharacterized protein n=1 Tax=Pseudomonas phage HRDY3 TaxID=3236930 RepID=A0AB39CER7_9VIRU
MNKHEHGYHGRSLSVAMLMRRAKALSRAPGDYIWDQLNARFVRAHHRWKTRYERQRQHAIHLEQLLAEKNAHIRELQNELREHRAPQFYAE